MIRALLSPGPAREFFRIGPLQHKIQFHNVQLAELRSVAARPRIQISGEAVEELIDRLFQYGTMIDAALPPIFECRDPNDDYVLSIAIAGSVEVILTEDDDLLSMNPWRGIRILRLFAFLREFPPNSEL